MKINWNFQGEGEGVVQNKKPSVGEYGKKVKVKGKGNLFYVKNTGSGCPSLPSQGLMIEVFDIHVKKKKKI